MHFQDFYTFLIRDIIFPTEILVPPPLEPPANAAENIALFLDVPFLLCCFAELTDSDDFKATHRGS